MAFLLVVCDEEVFRFLFLLSAACGSLLLEKQGVSLVFNLFSSFTP